MDSLILAAADSKKSGAHQGAMAGRPKRRLSEVIGDISPDLREALESLREFAELTTSGISLDYTTGAEVDVAIGALGATQLSNSYLHAIDAKMENLKTQFQKIAAAVEDERNGVPFTISREDEFDLLRNFSTHPKGLGLSEEEFLAVFDRGDWLKTYQNWKEGQLGGLVGRKPKGKRGRPTKEITSDIRSFLKALVESGHAVTPAILRRTAQQFYPTEWEKAGTEQERRKLQERVRSAILPGGKRTAR